MGKYDRRCLLCNFFYVHPLSPLRYAHNAIQSTGSRGHATHVNSLGVKDPAAIIFMADIENQGGAGASARIIKAASGKTLDALYASAKSDRVFNKYMARRDAVYKAVAGLQEGGKQVAVLIGHASIDENGTIQGKTPGDQTTKEICTRAPKLFTWVQYPVMSFMASAS